MDDLCRKFEKICVCLKVWCLGLKQVNNIIQKWLVEMHKKEKQWRKS